MNNLVNFTLGNPEDKIVTEYTLERTETKLVITAEEVGPNKGDSFTTTITKIIPWRNVSTQVNVGNLRRQMKIMIGVIISSIGALIMLMSLLRDIVCKGGMADMYKSYPWVCCSLGGFVLLIGLIFLVSGITRRKRASMTEIIIKDNSEVVETIKFNDEQNGEIAKAVIEFFRN